MSAFSNLRQSLVDELPGLAISPSWPEVLTPPCGFIMPPLTQQFIVAGPMYGEFTVSLDLVLLVAHDDADIALTNLEEMVEYALSNTADWKLTGVDPPAPTPVTEGGADYLASVIHLSKPVRIGA